MNTKEDPPVDPPFLRGLRHPSQTHTHTLGEADRVKWRLSPAYLPPRPTTITTNRSKAMSVSDEEEKCEGLDRDHRETRARRLLLEPRRAEVGGGVERVEKVVSFVCVRRGGGYQSCCQSAGQVVIREAVWQPVGIYLCLRLSTSHTHTQSLKRWRKTQLCSPLPPLSEHSAGVPGEELDCCGSHLSSLFCG